FLSFLLNRQYNSLQVLLAVRHAESEVNSWIFGRRGVRFEAVVDEPLDYLSVVPARLLLRAYCVANPPSLSRPCSEWSVLYSEQLSVLIVHIADEVVNIPILYVLVVVCLRHPIRPPF